MMRLRSLLLTLFAVCLGGSAVSAAADNPLNIEVWKSASCMLHQLGEASRG